MINYHKLFLAIFFGFSLTSYSFELFSLSNSLATSQEGKKDGAEVYVLAALKESEIEARKLHCKEIRLFNHSLAKKEYITVKLEFSYRRVEEVVDILINNKEKAGTYAGQILLAEKEAAHVQELIAYILDPIKDFFKDIKAHETLLSPVVNESLNRYAKEHDRDFNALYFKLFLEGNQRDVFEFLALHVTTHEKLYYFCQELKTFIFDIFVSSDEKVLKKHLKEVLKLRGSAGS